MDPIAVFGLQEVALRLGIATLIGGILGLNRELKGKAAGFGTHALVTLGSAATTLVSTLPLVAGAAPDPNALGRVIQGVLTGIGFLGAGVILRDAAGHVRGLTTAATVWTAAVLGILSGLGDWWVLGIAGGLAWLVLTSSHAIERLAERVFGAPATRD